MVLDGTFERELKVARMKSTFSPIGYHNITCNSRDRSIKVVAQSMTAEWRDPVPLLSVDEVD